MHPSEMRACRVRRQPVFGVLYNFHTAPFNPPPARLGRRLFRKVVVKIEPAVEPRSQCLAVENDRSDKCSRLIAGRLEEFGKCQMRSCQWYAEILHPVRTWKQT